MNTNTLEQLRQHELIILRRLRTSPLTEFELVHEITEHSAFTAEQASEYIGSWLESLRDEGLIWMGKLHNQKEQSIYAAALSMAGRKLVG